MLPIYGSGSSGKFEYGSRFLLPCLKFKNNFLPSIAELLTMVYWKEHYLSLMLKKESFKLNWYRYPTSSPRTSVVDPDPNYIHFQKLCGSISIRIRIRNTLPVVKIGLIRGRRFTINTKIHHSGTLKKNSLGVIIFSYCSLKKRSLKIFSLITYRYRYFNI